LIITFAHIVGEFGVVLTVGGSIPNETLIASIAIFKFVGTPNYLGAHIHNAIMIVMSFTVLLLVYIFLITSKKEWCGNKYQHQKDHLRQF
jgi:molybdate transport system permease protein